MRLPDHTISVIFILAVLITSGTWFEPFSGVAGEHDDLASGIITLNKSAGNKAISVTIHEYSLLRDKLGESAPDSKIWLVLSGTLTNLHPSKGASIPPVDKAFFLKIGPSNTVYLDKLSEDSVDPFWGELILGPGEAMPFEALYLVEAKKHQQIAFMHLSNKGPIKIYVVGEGPKVPKTLLSDSVQVGNAQIAVEKVRYLEKYKDAPPPTGKQYLSIDFWFTNMMELQPLETYLPDLIVVEEGGRYSYPPLAARRTKENLLSKTYYPLEPTSESLVFAIPKDSGFLQLVYFSESGPLKINLTPDVVKPQAEEPIAGPVGERLLKLSIFQSGSRFIQKDQILLLDVGLQLNHPDPKASFTIKPFSHFELHSASGNFTKPAESSYLKRPLGETDIYKDTITRGQLAFQLTDIKEELALVIPFAAGPTRLPIPQSIFNITPPEQETTPQVLPVATKAKPQPEEKTPPNLLSGNIFGGIAQQKPAPQNSKPAVKTPAPSAPAPSVQSPSASSIADSKRILAVQHTVSGKTVYLGNVATESEYSQVTRLIGTDSATNHVQLIPAGTTHPRTIRIHAQNDIKNAGLTRVQVRARKQGELILVGTVASDKEKKLAASIARLQPGITKVVNGLKIK